MNLLSDAAQSQTWEHIAPQITKGKTLYFSHGFSVVYKDDTHVVPPKDVDVILVAPKGSGRTVRTLFKEGRGINVSTDSPSSIYTRYIGSVLRCISLPPGLRCRLARRYRQGQGKGCRTIHGCRMRLRI